MPDARTERSSATAFEQLYAQRKAAYAKHTSTEGFLTGLNEYLQPRELDLYVERDVAHPFVFVLGPPRSGTTLLSQLLAYCLDAGYINNFVARFWLAPVHGIRLGRIIAGTEVPTSFESDYARTDSMHGIHEFGYFWRHWLNTHTFEDIVHSQERAGDIDWTGLRRVLANVQHEFGKPLVAKNILGAYYMPALTDVLGKVIFVHIERDPLDCAVSILDARRRYYSDPSAWWSYVPLEYPRLRERDPWEQIAGQVHYLSRFYTRALDEVGRSRVVSATYEQLCRDPASILRAVRERAAAAYGYRIALRQAPPSELPLRRYTDRDDDKRRFERLLADFRARDSGDR